MSCTARKFCAILQRKTKRAHGSAVGKITSPWQFLCYRLWKVMERLFFPWRICAPEHKYQLHPVCNILTNSVSSPCVLLHIRASALFTKYAIDMKKNAEQAADKEPIFIGQIIEEELRRQERTVTWLSRKIHCDRRNMYDIFKRTTIDTGLLYKICIALNRDFFSCYSKNLHEPDSQLNTPPRRLTSHAEPTM